MISFAQWGNELYYGKRSYNIVGRRRLLITGGLTLIAIAVLLMVFPGLNPGIEFKGGTEFTISSPASSAAAPATEVLGKYGHSDGVKVSTLGSSNLRIQTEAMGSSEMQEASHELASAYGVDDDAVAHTLIGPTWGKTVSMKAVISLLVFLALVSVVMALYFWTWTMSVAAIFALLHDVIFTLGIFAITQVEVTPASIIGILTILGYSLYDTVVVFDKVRELTHEFTMQRRHTYAELVNLSVNQTMVRSINTSVTAILPVASILFVGTFLLGAGTLRDIALALFVGMIVGTASSIFLAPAMLVTLRSRERVVKEHNLRVQRRREKLADSPTEDTDASGATPLSVEAAGYHLGQEAQPVRKPRSKR